MEKFFLLFKIYGINVAKFIGEYNAKLDDKGRLVFPSGLKALADTNVPLRFVVKKDLFSPCLEMYSYDEWEKQSEAVKPPQSLFQPGTCRFVACLYDNRAVVEPDEKSRKDIDSQTFA